MASLKMKQQVETVSTETSDTTASADSTITNQQSRSTSTSSISGFEYVPHSADDIAKVKSTIRIYNKHFLHFVQDENARANVFKTGLEKKQVKRPDLIAVTQMRNSNEILFPRKRLGHLPGIDVGCQFYSRSEMVAVGLHSHWVNGIDYMGKPYSKMEEYKGYKFPLAVAIVCSGQYEDDEDNREEIEYTGQGGNDFHGTKRQIKNQEMSPGNLALKKTGLEKKQVKRPDLIAVTQMRNSNEILFPRKRLGHLPGIDVGCQFYSRSEMVAVGLHSHWVNGIDYMGKPYSKMEEYKGYKFPLAVAIVCSGQYEDDEDNREEIEYTGQGGNDFHGTKRQIKNQEMSPGNLALKNCMEQSIPVRFIRGIPGYRRLHGDNKRFKLYTYDGLYKVDSYQLDEGKSGFAVYKFRLKRLEGQPKLKSNKVQYSKYNSMRPSSVPKLVSLDITGGQEKLPIPVINAIDDTTITGKIFYSTISLKIPSLVPSAC
ncbi:histone-lysine N-methyltransferase, H3 lysine-9 specific SUVH4 [Artemisia annua]|uniref:Histone-lysine N-methyltransferase, H3 lysine-9 specific SUVH4 n=1 Tax=Artemisia annua TaxID=35608 RepID=A0A2U1KG31_ARTAN|nr:histone-lysine N-methyltransferase, H3 lysine-9 specific SUVH4 [Artemisia annua]